MGKVKPSCQMPSSVSLWVVLLHAMTMHDNVFSQCGYCLFPLLLVCLYPSSNTLAGQAIHRCPHQIHIHDILTQRIMPTSRYCGHHPGLLCITPLPVPPGITVAGHIPLAPT